MRLLAVNAAWTRIWLLAIALFVGLQGIAWATDTTNVKAPTPSAKINSLPAGLVMRYPEGDTAKVKSINQESYYHLFFFLNNSSDTIRLRTVSAGDAYNLVSGAHYPVEIKVNGQSVLAMPDSSLKPQNQIKFPPGLPVKIELRTSLPTLGNWLIVMSGTQVDASGSKIMGQLFQQIAVTRIQGPAIPGKMKPSFILDDIATLNAGTCNAALRLNLRDTSGTEHTLNLPQILLNLKGDADAKYQACFKAVKFTNEHGDSLGSVVVPAGKSIAVMAHFQGLRKPGAYTGSLTMSGPGMIEVTKTFSINVRASIMWAIVLIALGVLGGQGIVYLMSKVKPRLQMARKVAMLRDEIGQMKLQFGELKDDEKMLWTRLEGEANRLATELNSFEPTDGAARILVLDAKINVITVWMQMHIDVGNRLQEGEVTQPIADALLGGQQYIELQQADATGAAAIVTAMQGIPAQIDAILAAKVAAAKAAADEINMRALESVTELPPLAAQPKVERKYSSLQSIERMLFLINAASTATIMLLSTLIGLKLFYLDNYSWGSCADMIYIFLWGFGLHTVAKNTDFTGGVFSFISGRFAQGTVAPVPPPPPPAAEGGGGGGANPA